LRIDTTNRTSATGRSTAAGRSGAGADFVPAGGAAPARVAGNMPVHAMAGLDSILALQAVDEPLTAKRRAVRRGVSLLDMLDDIRTDLLVGRVSSESLDGMMTLLSELRERTMPGLDALLDDIELRVRVELAKFGRFPPI
jgi:hypothetical protein